jgi:DNA-binding IclR family transcriptional regulator
MMFVEALEGQALIGLRLFTGMRIPLAVSAMGRAYLAGLADREREDVMAELEVEAGKRWRTVKRGIVQAIEEVKGRGFCLSIGDWRPEINGAAAAVRLEDGRVFAIDLGGPAYLLSEARLIETLGAQVAMTARMIESAVSTKRPGDVSGGRSLGKRTN